MRVRVKRKVRFTRFDAVMLLGTLVGAAAIAGLVWLSEMMVAPPRVRISESSRPVIGLTVRESPGRGGLVVVRAVSPALEAGLRAGDRIVRLGALTQPGLGAFLEAVRNAAPGERFTIEARRGDPAREDAVLCDVAVVTRPVSPADEGLPFEEAVFRNPDGLELRGWFVPAADGGRAPAVAYGHGNAADRRQWLPAAWAVHRAGIAQLFVDFAGRGESEGEVITLGAHEAGDLRAALDWLSARPDVDPARLALAGKSMGASAAILAAAEDARVKVLVLDSPFADLASLVDRILAGFHLPADIVRRPLFKLAGWRAHFDPALVRPIDAIARVKVPALLLHGDRDEIVPFEDAGALQRAAAGPLTLIPLAGLGHNTERPPEIYERIARYLAGTLG